jgi:hypothetical protein
LKLEVHSEISYSLFFWNGKSKLYPGSIELSISETYGGLVGGHINLAYMPLVSEATKDAVSVLARYNHGLYPRAGRCNHMAYLL